MIDTESDLTARILDYSGLPTALDLGGVRGPEDGTIDFDAQAGALGISTGNVYTLDVFHAERHTSQSNFRIETSIDCLVVVD